MNFSLIVKEPFKFIGFRNKVGVNPKIGKTTEILWPEVIKQLKSISNVELTGIRVNVNATF